MWFLLPAAEHDFIEGVWTVLRLGHSETTLDLFYHLTQDTKITNGFVNLSSLFNCVVYDTCTNEELQGIHMRKSAFISFICSSSQEKMASFSSFSTRRLGEEKLISCSVTSR